MKNNRQSIFLRQSEVATYCRNQNIKIKHLPNGVLIILGSQNNPESVSASLNFTFSSGAYFDPPSKAGIHHLLEHLINPPISKLAANLHVSINAQTSYANLIELCNGPFSSKVKNYGLLPLLSHIYESLMNPSALYENLEETLSAERHVIRTEIEEKLVDHNWLVWKKFYNLYLKKGNPILTDVAGTIDTLNNVTKKDISRLIQEVLVSDNLVISAVNEGHEKNGEILFNKLINVFRRFRKSKNKKAQLDWNLLDLTKSFDSKSGQVHYVSTGLHNGLVSILFSFELSVEEFSVFEFGLKNYVDYLMPRVHQFSRQYGLGYYSSVSTERLAKKGIIVIRFDVVKKSKSELEQIINFIQKNLPTIFFLSKTEISTIVQTEKNKQIVIPLTTMARIQWMLFGYFRYKKFINADYVKKTYADINDKHIEFWSKKLHREKALITVIGDVS